MPVDVPATSDESSIPLCARQRELCIGPITEQSQKCPLTAESGNDANECKTGAPSCAIPEQIFEITKKGGRCGMRSKICSGPISIHLLQGWYFSSIADDLKGESEEDISGKPKSYSQPSIVAMRSFELTRYIRVLICEAGLSATITQ